MINYLAQVFIFTNDGSIAVIQGDDLREVFKHAYAKYLLMHEDAVNPDDGYFTTSGFFDRLVGGGLIEVIQPTQTIFFRFNTYTTEVENDG